MKPIICNLLFFIISLNLCAQQSYRTTLYTSNDGLPASQIKSIFQDSRDFLWIGTFAGLSRFDGHSFTNFGAADGLFGSFVLKTTEDKNGNLWIATSNGLFKYNGKIFQKIPGSFTEIYDLLPINNTIWIASKNGLYSYDFNSKKTQTYGLNSGLLSMTICALYKSKNGQLLIATDKGICTYASGKFYPFWKPESSEFILNMGEDAKGNIWFNTLNNKTYIETNHKFRYFKRDSSNLNPFMNMMAHYNPPLKIFSNNNGDLVMSYTHFFEIYRNEQLYQRTIIVNEETNASFDAIMDKEGNYWFATKNGLLSMRPTAIKNYKTGILPFTGLYNTLKDTNVYFSNGANIFKFTEDSIVSIFNKLPELTGAIETFDKKPDGNFLIGTRFGSLFEYQNGAFKALTSNGIWSSLHSTEEELWLGLTNGLTLFENNKTSNFPYNTEGTNTYKFISLCKLPGYHHLAVGFTKGLFEFNDGIFSPLYISGFDKEIFVSDIKAYKNNIYLLSTMGFGLLVVDYNNHRFKLIKTINTQNGLGNNYIRKVIINKETVWALALNGIYKIDNILNKPKIDYLGVEDGLPANSWFNSDIAMDANGKIYVAGDKGVVSFSNNNTIHATLPQKTWLTSIQVGNKPFKWDMDEGLLSFTGIPNYYEFSHNQNSISFSFTGINLTKPSKIRYEYILKGYIDSLLITKAPYVNYNDLPPGNYTFKVRSTVNETFEHEEYATFSFIICRPFWATWWFRFLVVSGISCIVYLFYRWRLYEQLNKQKVKVSLEKQITENKMLAFQARMNPHFIFNSLNAIQYFIMHSDKIATLNYLSKFSRLLRQILDNTIDVKINLHKEIDMLRSYIEIEQLRFENQFFYQINFHEKISPDDIEIPGMIIQPFVENAIIHGLLQKKDIGMLIINFNAIDNKLICIVQDNGIGRNASNQLNKQKMTSYQSHGTSIAINRLKMYNDLTKNIEYNVVYEDIEQNGICAGTKVIIEIPIL